MSEEPSANAPEAVLGVLRDNFEELRGLLDSLELDDLDRRLAEHEWSVREILLHVLHAERWLHPQLLELRRAVAPAGALPAAGGVRLPDSEADPDLNELRWALGSVREDTERLVQGLGVAQLREPANVEIDGETVDLSLRTMVLTAADHQLFHVRQIERTLGRRSGS